MVLEIIEKMNAPSNRNCPLRAAFRGFVIAFRNRARGSFHSDSDSDLLGPPVSWYARHFTTDLMKENQCREHF